MLRKLLNVGLLLTTVVLGCTSPAGTTCSADTDCGADGACDLAIGLCYAKGTEPEVPSDECSPACASYEICTTGGCRARFTGLNILSPAATTVLSTPTVEMSVQVLVNPRYEASTQLPETLIVTPERADGSGGGVGAFGPVTRNGNIYTAVWTLPTNAQGSFRLKVAHPTAGAVPEATVVVNVDTQPPSFTISVPTPPNRPAGSAEDLADQRDPASGPAGAFRRNETVTVTVEANEPVGTVTLVVKGVGSDGNPGAAQPAVPVTPLSSCVGGKPFCGTVDVDLSRPEMKAFRGNMEFVVEGQDNAGNRGSDSELVPVTRWKWAFTGNGNILGTPAIGNTGTVYFGTNALGSGKLYAVDPDGDEKWEFATGDVSGSPAVGVLASDVEHVYVGARKNPTTFLYAFRGDGTKAHDCTISSNNENQGAVAVGITQGTLGARLETGLSIFTGGQVRIVGIRPTASIDSQCIELTGFGGTVLPPNVAGGAVVMRDQIVFYGADGPIVTSYDLGTGSNSPRPGWPQNTSSLVHGLALVGDELYSAAGTSGFLNQGGLFKVPIGGSSISSVYPTTSNSRVFNLAIGGGNTAYFGAETTSTNNLLSLALDTTGATPAQATGVSTLRGAPVVTKNDGLYTLNTQGRVTAWKASTLEPVWNVEVPGADRDVSLTLDCHRQGNGSTVTGSPLGTLYAAVNNKVYAFIVDSPGLANAPWPKYQRDARNTGNPATSIASCP